LLIDCASVGAGEFMIGRWAGVLGLVGFLSGFIGPMVLSDGNQGPMTGIFITGPGGAMLGAVLGAIARLAGTNPRTSSRLLLAAAVALALATIYVCIPEARHAGDVVAGEIRSCVPAANLKARAIARLTALEATRPQKSSTAWGAKFDEALAANPGVVVALHVRSVRRVFEGQAAWNKGALQPRPWHAVDADISYFVPDSACGDFPSGTEALLVVRGIRGVWPPYGIAELLDMQLAEPLPANWSSLGEGR
jgi:hypothetical protein